MHKVRIIIFMREECVLGFNCSATKQQIPQPLHSGVSISD